MKKILFLVILIIFIPININALSAHSAIVMDQDSKRVLFEKNMNDKNLIASITKIMTAIIAIEEGNLQKDIKVNNSILQAYGSSVYLEVGEILTLEDLLYGLMLRSGNDTAIVIANEISGNMEKFAALMNYKAKELGMNNTMFYNSHGLEEKNNMENKSTAYDMAILTSYAMQNDTFKKIVGTKTYTTKTNFKPYVWSNKNRLLNSYEYTTGGKTGYTELAGRTLVTTATKDNENLVIVTLKDGNDFANHQSLYEEYFNKYNLVKVLDKDNLDIKVPEKYQEKDLTIKNDYQVLLTSTEEEKLKITTEFNEEKSKIGKINIYIGDKLLHQEDIYIKEDNKKDNIFKRILDFIIFWD